MPRQSFSTARSEAAADLLSDILGPFIGSLRAAGSSASQVSTLQLGARHFLTWLDHCGIAVESVDDAVLSAFRRHDCHYPDKDRG